MFAQPSYGCYFLLAVIIYSGNTAQDGQVNKQNKNLLSDENDLDILYADYDIFSGETHLVCNAEFCVRKCCPWREVRPVCNDQTYNSLRG